MSAPARQWLQRDDYAPTVHALLPGVEGEELALRCSLLLMRDHAMATKAYCSEEAWGLLDYVERIASRFALHSMKMGELAEIRRVLVMTVASASSMEAMFQPTLQMEAAGNG